MPAPDIQTLYDFESQIEGAFETLLAAQFLAKSITCSTSVSRDLSIDSTPRVEIVLSLAASLNQRTTIGQATPKQVPNAFAGNLAISVVTTRGTNRSSHGPIRGVVRYVMSGANGILSDVVLPYLQILDLVPAASAPEVYAEKDQDITVLNYAIAFAVKDSAWPATA